MQMRQKRDSEDIDPVLFAAQRVIDQKGFPWSETEFENAREVWRGELERGGASAEELERYDKLIADAPVRGGRFNRYSGD